MKTNHSQNEKILHYSTHRGCLCHLLIIMLWQQNSLDKRQIISQVNDKANKVTNMWRSWQVYICHNVIGMTVVGVSACILLPNHVKLLR